MKIKLFIFALLFSLCLTSCYTTCNYATTQDDIYIEAESDIVQSNVDFNIVITNGRPYYYNGSIIYYLYNNLYYYPFYYDNYWYVRAYRKPFNHLYYRPYFRPHRYDYRFSPGYYHGFDRPRVSTNHYRNITPNKPRRNITYPHNNYRSNRNISNGRGKFGGKRR